MMCWLGTAYGAQSRVASLAKNENYSQSLLNASSGTDLVTSGIVVRRYNCSFLQLAQTGLDQ